MKLSMTISAVALCAAPALTIFALATFGLAGSASAQPAPKLDPACFANAPWEVDASQGPIRVFGCRAPAKIAAPDSNGWIEFDRPKATDGTDAGWIRAKMEKILPSGAWVFDVQDNGGGSGVFPYRVTGTPGPKGVLAKAGLKIDALPAGH